MCLILFAYKYHPNYPLIVAANRDEFYSRPTSPAHYWSDQPDILAGRDLKELGTWMGITVHGRFAALTNYRDPSQHTVNPLSRGHLVANYLKNQQSPQEYLEDICKQADQYNGFNLLVGDLHSLWYYGNKQGQVHPIVPGVHGLCNHLLNTPWPKLEKGRQQLIQCLTKEEVCEDDLWHILTNEEKAADDLLPNTGVGLDLERTLSPIFIASPEYGTRSSTLLLIRQDGWVTFAERKYHSSQSSWQNSTYNLQLKL